MKNGRYSGHAVVGEAGFLLPDRAGCIFPLKTTEHLRFSRGAQTENYRSKKNGLSGFSPAVPEA